MTSHDLHIAIEIFLALTALIVLGGHAAATKDWFSPLSGSAKAQYAPITHFFAFSEHAGVWVLIVLNGFLAWAMMLAWRQWNLLLFAGILMVMLIVSIYMMQACADGDNDPSKRVLSAFSQNGLLTLPGVLLSVSMAIAYTITVMYFLTPGTRDGFFPVLFAIALTFYLAFGLLQPPRHVWGEIHKDAWTQFIGGIAVAWILCAIKFAITM